MENSNDLLFGAAILLGVSATLFAAGCQVGRRAPVRTVGVLLTVAVASLLVCAVFGTDRLFWAQLLPVPGAVVVGNALLPGIALVSGLLLSPVLKAVPLSRRRFFAALLLVCGMVQAVRPFLGTVPATRAVPVGAWQNNVCPQTSDATCSAASAASLLHASGIIASETEMAHRCLTRLEGTLMLGAYRGLRQKTQGTRYAVRVLNGVSITELREATHTAPVLISVGIDAWQRGRIDPRYESLWGWTPGKRHAVVLFGFLPDGKLDIGDPSAGREVWSVEALTVLWRGDALQIVPR